MFKYLKEQQYYEDLYDTHTIEICLDKIEYFRKVFSRKETVDRYINENKGHTIKDLESNVNKLLTQYLYFARGDRYRNRQKTIQEWIARDESKDNRLENTEPKTITCYYCNSTMGCDYRTYHAKNSDKPDDIILFFYTCPKCKKRRAFFEDGEEFLPKSELCPKCENEIIVEDKSNENKLITIYKCSKCNYSKTSETKKYKPKEFDKEDFIKLKEEFCLNEKDGAMFITKMFQLDSLKETFKEIEEKKKHQAVYDKIKELNKLKVFDLQELLSKELEKHKLVRLSFKEPEIDKFVTIEFTIQDADSSRNSYSAEQLLKKQIEIILKEANWTLMSDGISSRLGILSGRLKAYEREEDLFELVNKRFKDLKPKEEENKKKDFIVKGLNGEDITL